MNIEQKLREYRQRYAMHLLEPSLQIDQERFLEQALKEQQDFYENVISKVIGQNEPYDHFDNGDWSTEDMNIARECRNDLRDEQRKRAKQLLATPQEDK